ncbi:8390_t:CDS:2, partial [Funneliformis geosporum]
MPFCKYNSDEDKDWNSDIYDNIDEDDLLQVDELEEEQDDNIPAYLNIYDEDLSNTLTKSEKQ